MKGQSIASERRVKRLSVSEEPKVNGRQLLVKERSGALIKEVSGAKTRASVKLKETWRESNMCIKAEALEIERMVEPRPNEESYRREVRL